MTGGKELIFWGFWFVAFLIVCIGSGVYTFKRPKKKTKKPKKLSLLKRILNSRYWQSEIDRVEKEYQKEQMIMNRIYTNYDTFGKLGYEAKKVEEIRNLKFCGVERSGYVFMYTVNLAVYIDFNCFKTEDIVLVKDLLHKKYTELLDTYSQFCLEAKKNVINNMYGGEDDNIIW